MRTINEIVNQHKTVCHSEEGIKFIIEEKLCSESYQQTGTNKSYWYLKSKKMLKRVQHDTNFLVKKYAFTLAEVLITLSILGVVAAISIPNIVNRANEKYAITSVKRAYSILDTAIQEAIAIEGPLANWAWPYPSGKMSNSENSNFFFNNLSKYLSTKCIRNNKSCMPTTYGYLSYGHYLYKNLDGNIIDNTAYGITPNTHRRGMILKNGMFITFNTYWEYPVNSINDGLGAFIVDINGAKNPNRLGYDVFVFGFNGKDLNLDNVFYANKSHCRLGVEPNNIASGISCGAYVIKYGNMNYKRKDIGTNW